MSYYENETVDRAVEKYLADYRDDRGFVVQPNRNLTSEVEIDGDTYVVVANVNGLLAVYEVVDGEPVKVAPDDDRLMSGTPFAKWATENGLDPYPQLQAAGYEPAA